MGGFAQVHRLPLVGTHVDNPYGANLLARMKQGAIAQQAYRPELAQARVNAAQQTGSLFSPVNVALGGMYGPGAQFDLMAAAQSPMSPRMQQIGRPGLGRDIGGEQGQRYDRRPW